MIQFFTCKVSRVNMRPPSLSMPTDLKISPDSNSSFALKAPLEMQELVYSFGKLILLTSKQDDGFE